jgi:DNA mismatch repair protein MutS2
LIGTLQAAADSVPARDAMRAAQETATTLAKLEEAEAEKLKKLLPESRANEPLAAVRVGDWVHVRHLGKDGDVLGVEGKEAQVAIGNLRMRVALSSLLPPRGKRPKKGEGPQGPERGRLKRELSESKVSRPAGGQKVTEELDLRGTPIDEALDRLDAFLDHHYGTPTTHVRIVHGHGTGALRTAIRVHLRSSGYVRAMRPGDDHEGGDGATVVELT